jgi:hypothetical protein
MLNFETFTICNHDMYFKNFDYICNFMFQNINYVLFNMPLSQKM